LARLTIWLLLMTSWLTILLLVRGMSWILTVTGSRRMGWITLSILGLSWVRCILLTTLGWVLTMTIWLMTLLRIPLLLLMILRWSSTRWWCSISSTIIHIWWLVILRWWSLDVWLWWSGRWWPRL